MVLMERGHHVEIAPVSDATDAPGVKDFPGKVHALGPSHVAAMAARPRFIPWVRAAQRRFDTVIVHGLWQFNSYGVWRALR